MLTDTQISSRFAAMVAAIQAPHAPTGEILLRASHPEPLPRQQAVPPARTALAAAIAAGIIVVATPIVAPSVVETLQARIAQLMQWTPPPAAPKSVDSAMVPRRVSLHTAQTLVPFRIVPPAGLPRDVVSESIFATPTAVYSKVTHSWTVGPPSLTFSYRRADGKTFALVADAFDPREGLPPKYIFDADETGPDGLPRRHENFAWRNGNQTMGATDDDISAAEIQSICAAMHGIPLRLAASRAALDSGTIVKKYRVP